MIVDRCPDGGTLEQYIGIGPVEARTLTMLSDYSNSDFATSISERSPVGPRAVRIRQRDPDGSSDIACLALARWLDSKPWVEAVAARPPHVYVRIGTDTLRGWVAAEFAGHKLARGDEGGGRPVIVRFADADVSRPRPLDLFREAAVGRAVVALLHSRGFDVMLDPVATDEGRSAVTRREGAATDPECRGAGSVAARTVVVGSSPSKDANIVWTRVGGVDVPHGPLRARHGGAVTAEDLLRDILDRLAARHGSELRVGRGPWAWSNRYAEALLEFVLLRTERARRIQLSDARLQSESATFESMLAARWIANSSARPSETASTMPLAGRGRGERAVHDLVIEIDLLPTVMVRAGTSLEPALLARFVRSLADRTHAAHAYLPAADPLWSAVGHATDVALASIGIDVPREVYEAKAVDLPWLGPAGPVGGDHYASQRRQLAVPSFDVAVPAGVDLVS